MGRQYLRGGMHYRLRQFEEAARCYEKAVRLPDTSKSDAGQLLSCYTALGDAEGQRRAAEIAVIRAQEALTSDSVNAAAMGCAVAAYAVLGQPDTARDLIRRALLIDPNDMRMRYNFACGAISYLKDADTALDLLGPVFPIKPPDWFEHVAIDPDLDALRDDPRFKAMLAAAEARLASAG